MLGTMKEEGQREVGKQVEAAPLSGDYVSLPGWTSLLASWRVTQDEGNVRCGWRGSGAGGCSMRQKLIARLEIYRGL